MRVSTLASFALFAYSGFVSARGTLGFALGTKKADGSCKYTADYEADFAAIEKASGSKIVRGYSADDCNSAQQMLPAAKNKGFKVILGVWYVDFVQSFTRPKCWKCPLKIDGDCELTLTFLSLQYAKGPMSRKPSTKTSELSRCMLQNTKSRFML